MRYRVLRFDIWLCLLFSVLLAMGAEKIASPILNKNYENYTDDHKVSKGEIGGVAGDDIYRVQSVEDILSHDVFTIESPGIEYRNRGAGYYQGMYLYAVRLPSGEIVAARINSDSVVSDSDSIYSGKSTLPVGKVIKANLKEEKTFLDQIEYKEPLSRRDFYIDMVGEAETISSEYYIDGTIMIIQILVVVCTFPIFHMIGSKLGIFPYFFAPKKKKEQEWD